MRACRDHKGPDLQTPKCLRRKPKVGRFIHMSIAGHHRNTNSPYSSITLVWCLLSAMTVHGRETRLPPPPAVNCSEVIKLRSRIGDQVRLICVDSNELRGEFVGANDVKLLLVVKIDSLTERDSIVAIQRIREITLSHSSPDMRNAATYAGAGVGVLCGVIIGGSAAPPPTYNWENGKVSSSKTKYKVIGGLVGGLVGCIGGRVLGAGLRSSITLRCF